jgi:hypothetical protein
MDSKEAIQSLDSLSVRGGRFSWRGLSYAVIGGVFTGVAWAWIAYVWQSYANPVVIFPLLLGVLIGLTVIGWTRFLQLGHRPTIVAMAVLAALTAFFGKDYFLGLWDRSWGPASASISNPFVIFWNELSQKLGWGVVDGLLTLAAAILVIIPAIRVPYCDRCRTWFRTVRNGKIDVATAQRLAKTCGVEGTENFHSPRYRLSCCHGGCSPTCCELTWENTSGQVELARVWLDGEKRNQVATVLDELMQEQDLDE